MTISTIQIMIFYITKYVCLSVIFLIDENFKFYKN